MFLIFEHGTAVRGRNPPHKVTSHRTLTKGLFRVSNLPNLDCGATYLERIPADTHRTCTPQTENPLDPVRLSAAALCHPPKILKLNYKYLKSIYCKEYIFKNNVSTQR